jgi:hypothetical protein
MVVSFRELAELTIATQTPPHRFIAGAAVAQGRHRDLDDAQAIVEILPKPCRVVRRREAATP